MLFLTYIQGKAVNEWVMSMSQWLNRQVTGGVPEQTPDLWVETEQAFRRRFANTLEREQAQGALKRGLKMKDGDLDTYITEFETLARQAGYRLSFIQTIDLFTDGLPRPLFEKVFQLDDPQTFEE